MAEREVDFLIVGGGLAAGKAAEGIREAGGSGSVLVLTAEPELPYERPPLSKEYLRGEGTREATRTHDAAWYVEHEVEVDEATRVAALDPGRQTATTDGGDVVRYQQALLATGAHPVTLDLPGATLDGVQYLRSLADADALRPRLGQGKRLVVIGGGFIGAEVAASATQLGTQVTLLEVAETLWTRAVGPELGVFFEDFLRDRGIDVRTRTAASAFQGSGQVEAVALPDGGRIEADTVVVGVGVRPTTDLAERAGLTVDNGVPVDARLHTEAEGLWAAGDVARIEHPLFGSIRVEHWDVALNQGLVAGKNMAGAGETYDVVPYFFSDQFDLSLSYLGYTRGHDEVVVRGNRDVHEPKFIAWYLEQGTPRAALIVNDFDAEDPVREIVRRASAVARERLADPGIALSDL